MRWRLSFVKSSGSRLERLSCGRRCRRRRRRRRSFSIAMGPGSQRKRSLDSCEGGERNGWSELQDYRRSRRKSRTGAGMIVAPERQSEDWTWEWEPMGRSRTGNGRHHKGGGKGTLHRARSLEAESWRCPLEADILSRRYSVCDKGVRGYFARYTPQVPIWILR